MNNAGRETLEYYIWKEIESLWQKCISCQPSHPVTGVPPEPPDFLHIEQRSKGSWKDARCKGVVIRVFHFNDSGARELSPPYPSYKTGADRGKYWQVGSVEFSISSDGCSAIFNFQVGPLCGRGYRLVYDDSSKTEKVRCGIGRIS